MVFAIKAPMAGKWWATSKKRARFNKSHKK
jgi:hypothetical protein